MIILRPIRLRLLRLPHFPCRLALLIRLMEYYNSRWNKFLQPHDCDDKITDTGAEKKKAQKEGRERESQGNKKSTTRNININNTLVLHMADDEERQRASGTVESVSRSRDIAMMD